MADVESPGIGQMVDPHAVLEVAPNADRAAIRAAYRRLAREFHPDVNRAPGAATRMREINAAYATLTGAEPSLLREMSVATPATPEYVAPRGTPSGSARPAATPPFRTTYPAGSPPVHATGSVGIPAYTAYMHTSPASGAAAGAAAMHTMKPAAIWMLGAFGVLVVFLAAWALSVSRPVQGVTAASTGSIQSASAASTLAESRIASAAAQASANAEANARAAKQNAESRGVATANQSTTQQSAATRTEKPAAGETVEVRTAAPLPPLSPALPSTVASKPAATATAGSVSGASEIGEVAIAPPASKPSEAAPTGAPEGTGQPARAAAIPSLPIVPAATQSKAEHIQAVSSQAATDLASTIAAARRDLSNYDRAWTNYAEALRSVAAGSLVSTNASGQRIASLSPSSAAAMLSGDAQLGISRALYLQQQSVWNRQTSVVYVTAGTTAMMARPDGVKASRADAQLRQAADLVSQAQSAGAPVPAAEIRDLLKDAEQLHREWIAEWVKLLGTLG
ncbi:MAG TPA: DnaJ domain-containing protein [Chloroflexota bacterium]|nr:DnaJ domain-containing protein [Chloroflexota bacterium]